MKRNSAMSGSRLPESKKRNANGFFKSESKELGSPKSYNTETSPKVLSPKMGSPKVGSPRVGSPRVGSPLLIKAIEAIKADSDFYSGSESDSDSELIINTSGTKSSKYKKIESNKDHKFLFKLLGEKCFNPHAEYINFTLILNNMKLCQRYVDILNLYCPLPTITEQNNSQDSLQYHYYVDGIPEIHIGAKTVKYVKTVIKNSEELGLTLEESVNKKLANVRVDLTEYLKEQLPEEETVSERDILTLNKKVKVLEDKVVTQQAKIAYLEKENDNFKKLLLQSIERINKLEEAQPNSQNKPSNDSALFGNYQRK